MNNEEYKNKFIEIQKEMLEKTLSKHSDYGGDTVFTLGMKMRFADIYRKYCRIKSIVWDEKEIKVSDETVRDTLIDLANYSVIAIMQLDLGKNDSNK